MTKKIEDDDLPEDLIDAAAAICRGLGITSTPTNCFPIIKGIHEDRQRDQWQPIETAPKNTKLLAAYQNELGNWRIVTACYHTQLEWSDEYGDHEEEYAPEGWYEENDSSEVIYPTSRHPSHWMPLPSPPRALDQKGGTE